MSWSTSGSSSKESTRSLRPRRRTPPVFESAARESISASSFDPSPSAAAIRKAPPEGRAIATSLAPISSRSLVAIRSRSGLSGEQRDELFVFVGEVCSTLFLGQVEVAVGDAAQQDRNTEERVHRRVSGRESDRTRVLRQIVQAQRTRVADQDAEDAATVRRVADLS